MPYIKPEKCCAVCNKELFGRKNKVYCNTDCKNEHHRLARVQTKNFKTRNKILKRNNVVLEGLFGRNTSKVKIDYKLLFKVGFDLRSSESKIKEAGKVFSKIGDFCFRLISGGILEIFRLEKRDGFKEGFFKRWDRIFEDYFERRYEISEKIEDFSFERVSFYDMP